MEQLADVVGGRWKGDWLVALLKHLDKPIPEQAIDVPKKSKSSRRCFVPELCFVPMEHQTAERLVEVPTSVFLSLCSGLPSRALTFQVQVGVPGVAEENVQDRIQQRLVAQNMLILQFLMIVAVGAERRGLQGFSQEQNSAAFRGAEHVDIQVPQNRGANNGLHGYRPGQGSSASSSMDRSYVAEGAFDGFFRTFPGVKKKCGVRQPVRRSPARFFSPSSVVAHSSSWSPAACGHGTLPVEDDPGR